MSKEENVSKRTDHSLMSKVVQRLDKFITKKDQLHPATWDTEVWCTI